MRQLKAIGAPMMIMVIAFAVVRHPSLNVAPDLDWVEYFSGAGLQIPNGANMGDRF